MQTVDDLSENDFDTFCFKLSHFNFSLPLDEEKSETTLLKEDEVICIAHKLREVGDTNLFISDPNVNSENSIHAIIKSADPIECNVPQVFVLGRNFIWTMMVRFLVPRFYLIPPCVALMAKQSYPSRGELNPSRLGLLSCMGKG